MADLKADIISALRTVHDPEIPVNLYDLGLIYDIRIDEGGEVAITMTLTTPNCPVADLLPTQVREAVQGVEGVRKASVQLVWEPAWSRERMSESAKMQLEMMGIDWSEPHRSGPGLTSLTLGRTKPAQRGED